MRCWQALRRAHQMTRGMVRARIGGFTSTSGSSCTTPNRGKVSGCLAPLPQHRARTGG